MTFLNEQNSFVYTQINGFKCFYGTQIILFNINHLFAHSQVVSSFAHTNSFICMQLNGYHYCYLTQIILFNADHSFAHS